MMTGRKPSARRSRTTPTMFFQFVTDETLVPPNLSTTNGEAPGAGETVVMKDPNLEHDPARLMSGAGRCAPHDSWCCWSKDTSRLGSSERKIEHRSRDCTCRWIVGERYGTQPHRGKPILLRSRSVLSSAGAPRAHPRACSTPLYPSSRPRRRLDERAARVR